jgi:hypothetical protein
MMTTTRQPTDHKIPTEVYRKIQDGRSVPGMSGLEYADGAAAYGYQIVTPDVASKIRVGDRISVGTGHLGDESKRSWREVTGIGEPFAMAVDHCVEDEDHSFDGLRTVGETRVKVQRIYFERKPGWNF